MISYEKNTVLKISALFQLRILFDEILRLYFIKYFWFAQNKLNAAFLLDVWINNILSGWHFYKNVKNINEWIQMNWGNLQE